MRDKEIHLGPQKYTITSWYYWRYRETPFNMTSFLCLAFLTMTTRKQLQDIRKIRCNTESRRCTHRYCWDLPTGRAIGSDWWQYCGRPELEEWCSRHTVCKDGGRNKAYRWFIERDQKNNSQQRLSKACSCKDNSCSGYSLYSQHEEGRTYSQKRDSGSACNKQGCFGES